MKNFNISGFHRKIKFLGGEGFTQNLYIGKELPKKEDLKVCRFKVGLGLTRKIGWCF